MLAEPAAEHTFPGNQGLFLQGAFHTCAAIPLRAVPITGYNSSRRLDFCGPASPAYGRRVIVTDIVISIDGPGAVGKTTIGRLLAKRLGLLFVDTGVMYRALTWTAIERGLDVSDEESLVSLARGLRIDIIRVPGAGDENPERVVADGRDVSDEIKRPEVDRQVSIVSRYRGVREAMVAQQRALATGAGVVMVGRDIGTVVLPDAALKIYLTASPDERARRRYQELRGLGASVEQTSILSDLVRRDKIDSERKESPLRPAPDSRLIDTTHLTLEQVVNRVLELWGAASG